MAFVNLLKGTFDSALSNQSSPPLWNFFWITSSPGVSVHPMFKALILILCPAIALAVFFVIFAKAALDAL